MSEIVVTPVTTTESASNKPVEHVVDTASYSAGRDISAATAAVEPPQAESKEPAASEEPRLGRRFAEITKRQRELYEKEQALKELEGRLNPVQQAIKAAKQNPLKLLEAAGISFEDLTEYVLSGDEGDVAAPDASPVEKKLQELELKFKAQEEAEQQQKQAAYEQQIIQFKNQINEAAVAYELVSTLEQTDLVYDVILEHHARTGDVLPIDKALAVTESYLEAQANKILSVPKFKANVTQVQEPKPVTPKPSLSRTTVPSPASVASASTGAKLSREQLLEQATSLLRFK